GGLPCPHLGAAATGPSGGGADEVSVDEGCCSTGELSRRARFVGLTARGGGTGALELQLYLRGRVMYASRALSHCLRRSGQLQFQAVCFSLQAVHVGVSPFPRISHSLSGWA